MLRTLRTMIARGARYDLAAVLSGVSARGDIVGFFSDGTKVHGLARLAPAREEFGWRD